MKIFINILFILIIAVTIWSCSETSVAEEAEMIPVTVWTERMELFIEYPHMLAGNSAGFIVHLTDTDRNLPVTSGTIRLQFTHENGRTTRIEQKELLRDGIYSPVVTLPEAGSYEFSLVYSGQDQQESFMVGNVLVHKEAEVISHEESESHSGISFLKEQQWKTKFRTECIRYQVLRSSIQVIGEVMPRIQGYAEVVAPVDGILSVEHNRMMVVPGARVGKGDVLITICPPVSGENSWTELQLMYERARAEFERASKLKEKDAISDRDYEEAKRVYLIHKSGYEAFLDLASGGQGNTDEQIDSHLALRSQISGRVAEVLAKPGQSVSVGQKLMTVVDPSKVWIRMNIYEKDYFRVGEPSGALIRLTGTNKTIVLANDNWRVLSMGEIVDQTTRTIPILIETDNPDGLLRIGQILQMELYTSTEKKVLAVPASAVFNEDVRDIVFVQSQGESFVKKTVVTGSRDNGWLEIISGLDDGDRVVTEGGYMVKLAANTSEIGHPHVH